MPWRDGQGVITLSYRRPDWFERLAESVGDGGIERVVVNQDPADAVTTARAAARGWQVYVPGRNLSFAAGNNRAARLLDCSHLVLVNNDAVLDVAVLERLWAARQQPIVGVVIRDPIDGRITHGGGDFNEQGLPYHVERDTPFAAREGVRSCPWVTFACAQIRRDVWEELGGLDESYEAWGGYEDLDFACRARERGHGAAVALGAVAWHAEFGTRQPADDAINLRRWHARWVAGGRALEAAAG